MSMTKVPLPTRTRIAPAARQPLELSARFGIQTERPRVVRMPADWWDSPATVACPLARGAQSARTARKVTRNTFRDWDLPGLADDAEAIVAEFVANAVTHAAATAAASAHGTVVVAASPEHLGLRLMRRSGEVMCAVLDPSETAPVLKCPVGTDEAGRGLQMVDALSDIWGWSPVAGRGKAVWAILFCS
jgi:anti-sigma regulatory factor (Ser/Thr protein kinase)